MLRKSERGRSRRSLKLNGTKAALNHEDAIVVSESLDVDCLLCLRDMSDEIGVGAQSIDAALAEFTLVRLALQVGGDDIGPVCGDPRGSVDKAGVPLSAEGVESFAHLCDCLRICLHGRGRDILTLDREVPLPAVSE